LRTEQATAYVITKSEESWEWEVLTQVRNTRTTALL